MATDDIELKKLLVMLLLRGQKPVGRYRLKELLDMQAHEGIVKRILADLTKQGKVKPTRSGSVLTEIGEARVNKFLQEHGIVALEQVDLRKAGIGPESSVIQIRDRKITVPVLNLRDKAIRTGAEGALILTYDKGRLGDSSAYVDLSEKHPEIMRILETQLQLREKDVVMVGFASTFTRALTGILSIGLELAGSENEK